MGNLSQRAIFVLCKGDHITINLFRMLATLPGKRRGLVLGLAITGLVLGLVITGRGSFGLA